MSSLNIIQRTSQLHQLDETILSPLLAKVYANRNIVDMDELNYSLAKLTSPNVLTNITLVCDTLIKWMNNKQTICIVGDYDVDGATSTTLLLKFFQHCQQPCEFYIPNRFLDGYGLSEKIVAQVHEKGIKSIITVDNGISSLAGVELANELGIEVIITDHHLPSTQLPNTPYIINPSLENIENQSLDAQPLRALAGVGVTFYLLMAMRSMLRQQHWFEQRNISEPNLADYLDLVALGTVADMVPLNYTNRILVSQGLKRMRAKASCAGIEALFSVAQKPIEMACTENLGYAIAPRLNAAGRLDDMSLGVKCLMSSSINDALQYALRLNDINNERKLLQQKMQLEAYDYVQNAIQEHVSNNTDSNNNDNAYIGKQIAHVVYQDNWHQGITGLIAGKLKERYHLPAIAFAKDDMSLDDAIVDNDEAESKIKLKGSARSIDNIHIKDVLNIVADQAPNILLAFGGHAMAAGMSIYEQDLTLFSVEFDKALRQYCLQSNLNIDELQEKMILSDGSLYDDDLSLNSLYSLENGGPWGTKFEAPVFDNHVTVVSKKILKEKHLKLQVSLNNNDGGREVFDAIYFNFTDQYDENAIEIEASVHIVYSVSVNRFRGQESPQLMIMQFNFA